MLRSASTDLPVTKPVRGRRVLISTSLAYFLQLKASSLTGGAWTRFGAFSRHPQGQGDRTHPPCRLHLAAAWHRQRPWMIGASPRFLSAVGGPRQVCSWSISTSMCFAHRDMLDRLSAERAAFSRVIISTSPCFPSLS